MRPTTVVVALDTLQAGGAFPRMVCVDPAAVDWTPLADQCVIIVHYRAAPERVRVLAECVLAVEPRRLDVCDLAEDSLNGWQTVLSDLPLPADA